MDFVLQKRLQRFGFVVGLAQGDQMILKKSPNFLKVAKTVAK
jgi:hypothetical protein